MVVKPVSILLLSHGGASRSELPPKAENVGVLKDFQQRVQEMPFSDKVSWAVGGMVLTAGLLFLRLEHFLVALFILLKLSAYWLFYY